MQPFHQIVPDAEPVMTLVLRQKTGAIPEGTYGFIECYCTDPQCDCRRVRLVVVNEKRIEKAVIDFGFDQTGPAAGPCLDAANCQSPFARELLEFFVESLNSSPAWLKRLYRHYRTVRERVERQPYAGKPFPRPGRFVYRVTPLPGPEVEFERPPGGLAAAGRPCPSPAVPGRQRGDREKGMAQFVKRYAEAGTGGPVAGLLALQDDLRRYLYRNEQAGEELASLLPELCQRSPEHDEQIDAALRLLFETLDVLRLGVESKRADARRRMEMLQGALARRIFAENEDLDLCAAVSNVLVQSRVEILPVLREATSRMMMAGAARSDLHDLPGEEIMTGISRSLESMGVSSPFEGAHELLQLFALNEPDMQTALIGEMLQADNSLLREISALMLFHHEPDVRLGVSQLLTVLDGRSITPETLRRLIVSRNWFPEEMRGNVDQAITRARKGRVACAPLARPPSMTVYASCIDGSGAQSFQVIVPDGKGFLSCSVLLKQGVGVTDAFLVALKNKRELGGFLGMLKKEGAFLKSSPEHLDLRVCQALADGARRDNVPSYQLVRIAELLGCDRWKSTPLDVERELCQLGEALISGNRRALDAKEHRQVLESSGEWVVNTVLFASWFEDDDRVDREIEASRGRRKSLSAADAVKRIIEVVLEERRAVWLERLVLTTIWLKNSKEAWTFPWNRLYHVSKALADRKVRLQQIPMMVEIAKMSYQAYRQRRDEGAKG